MHSPILVTCSRGTVGSQVVKQLTASGRQVKAGVHAAPTEAGTSASVQEVHCDFSKPISVRRALEGVQAVMLITPVCPESADYAMAFIDEAKQAGVRQIVRLSGAIAADESGAALGRWHRAAEDHLVTSGIDYSILRPTLFMQNFATYYRPDSLGYLYVACGAGRANYVDARDVAESAVRIIEGGQSTNMRQLLTGPAPLSSGEVAAALSASAGRKIASAQITPRQAALAMRLMGMPQWAVAAFKEIHELMWAGFYASSPSDAMARLLEGPPRSIQKFAADYSDAFATGGAGWASSIAARLLVRVAPR